MRIIKNFALVVLILASFSLLPQIATAGTSVAVGFSNYHHGYHSYYPYYRYRPFFYGYPYYGGFYPYYGFGYGYGYGYGGYGGYGYRPYGEVRTEVKPQNAQVFVDGGLVGKADDYDGWWQRLNLSPGMHRLVFRAPGFQPYVTDVRVGIGTDFHLKYEMRSGNDSIAEQEMLLPQNKYSRRGNDRRYENRPRNNPYPNPDPRDQQYERRPPQENRDNDYDNRDNDYNDNDQSYYGDDRGGMENDRRPLIVHVEPDDATIYIDGNYYGTANDNGNDIQVLLPEGTHRIEVVRPGFDSFSQEVSVGKNRDNHLNVILKKK